MSEVVIRTDHGVLNHKRNELLGKGAFSFVFKGSYEVDGQSLDVAVKRVEINRLEHAEVKREAEALQTLAHENVLKLILYTETEDFCYFVLELCAATLGDYIKNKYVAEIPSKIDCLRQMALGVEYIHLKPLVHRDIKPDNVLISVNPKLCLKISDFGLSKPVTKSGSFSMSGMKGTVNYMAPEIIDLDERKDVQNPRPRYSSDVFSLGCVFFVFLTKGVHPFGSDFTIPANIKQNKLEFNRSIVENIPVTYGLIKRMIDHTAASRPDMTTVVKELDRVEIGNEMGRA